MYKKLIEKKKEQVENIANKNLKINTGGMRSTKGITLIALVVTIVILIILATVAISVILGRNSLLDNAETGKKAYEKEEARERLQVVLADAFVDKHTNRDEYNENEYLDEYVKQREPEVSIAGNEIGLNGHVFELDRSVPQLGDYIGEEGNLPPKIGSVKVISKTETSGTVEVIAVRTEGVQYRYSIKELGQGDESYVQKVEKAENTNEFTGLQAPNKYVIKVELIKDGEIVDTDDSTVLLIGKLESGVVKFEDPVWNNGTASVKITTQEQGYKLQYQIDKTEASGWTDVTSGSIINGLKVNQVVFGRLWNGIDESEPASVNILDTIVPTVNFTTSKTYDSITVTVNATDNESGLETENIYTYSITGGSVEGESTVTKNENTHTFIGLTAETQYTIKVEVKDKANNIGSKQEYVTTDMQPDVLPEPPKVGEGMTPVKWNGSNWIKTDTRDSEWYDYSQKKWANVVLGDATFSGNTLDESKAYSMLVWIPRYAYQITTCYHTSSVGNIDIVFIDTENKNKAGDITYSENYPKTTENGGMESYIVHPAFNYGGEKLSGFWVGKYETSHTGCTTDVSTGQNNTNITTLTPMIKAGVTSWRNITVSNIYTVCTNMNKSGNVYGLNTSDSVVDPHMIKNSEWGAVVYLSHNKKYGNGTELWINSSSDYITGNAGNTVNSGATSGETNSYKSSNGQNASTTGNVTGVYDMNGGAWEYIAGYVNNGNSNLNEYGSELISTASKYKDVYSKGSNDYYDYNANYALSTPENGYYGDAIWETSTSGYTSVNSWYRSYSIFPNGENAFFIRGGNYQNNSSAGEFGFNSYKGYNNTINGFRVVIPLIL